MATAEFSQFAGILSAALSQHHLSGFEIAQLEFHHLTRPGCSLEGLMLKLKLQYFGHLVWRVDSLEKTLMLEGLGAGGKGDNRGWDGWMASPTRWTWVWVNSGSRWWTGRPGVLQFWGCKESDMTERLNWTELKYMYSKPNGIYSNLTVIISMGLKSFTPYLNIYDSFIHSTY